MEGLFPARLYPRVDPNERRRTKPMQVLCLGLSRTGTMSTYAGLKKLGFVPYHCAETGLDSNNDSLQHWTAAENAKYRGKGKPWEPKDFEKMLWRYDAITDIPCVLFTPELLAAYPNAKVILTTRPIDSWVDSMRNTFYPIINWWSWLPLSLFDRSFSGLYIDALRLPLQVWGHTSTTTTAIPDPELLRQGFEEHNAYVRANVDKERLLEWHPKDGWGPLCRHLGVDVPEDMKGKPFYNINDAVTTRGILAGLLKFRWIVVGVRAGMLGVVGMGTWIGWKLWNGNSLF